MSAVHPCDVPAGKRRDPMLLALVAGTSVANIYYHQPMIGLIDASFGSTGAAIMAIPAATLGGYAIGLLFLAPLGDIYPRRSLIVIQLIGVALALALLVLSSTVAVGAIACLLVGILSSLALHPPIFVTEIMSPERRGASAGFVMAGVIGGVLFARGVGGYLGEAYGWRMVFGASALAAVVLSVTSLSLPRLLPKEKLRYSVIIASMFTLVRRVPTVRHAMLVQWLLYGATGALWATLALRLGADGLSARHVGYFGLIAATALFIMPLAGRLIDRFGPMPVTRAAAALEALGFIVILLFGTSRLAGLAIGMLLTETGTNSSLIGNQYRACAAAPGFRGRANAIFMTTVFAGGASGALIGINLTMAFGWQTVPLLGLGFTLVACLLLGVGRGR